MAVEWVNQYEMYVATENPVHYDYEVNEAQCSLRYKMVSQLTPLLYIEPHKVPPT